MRTEIETPDTDTANMAVTVRNLVKRYPGPVTAVAGIDLDILKGEVFGLLGPNGAGKTTTIEILVGLRVPTEGTVRLLGEDPASNRAMIRENVAIQPQQATVFEHQTVAELLSLWASFYPNALDPDTVITQMGLEASRNVRTNKLSGGQQQRLLVGTALISRPKILVLDEPSTGMDPNAREDLWRAVRAYRDSGGTVLMSTHSMEEATTLCDRVAIIDQGRTVAMGTPADLVAEHTPEQELQFTVAAGSNVTELARHTSVQEMKCRTLSGGNIRVHLRTTSVDQVLLNVLTGPLRARQIQTKDAGLEDVFRRVTGRTFEESDNHDEITKESL